MADAVELARNIVCRHHIAVGEMAEVELDAGLQAPVEGHFVDGDGALAASWWSGNDRARRVRAVMGREADASWPSPGHRADPPP